MKVNLDRKSYSVLNLLYETKVGLTVEELSNILNVSQRSIYYSIKNINSELKRIGCDELSSIRNYGFSLNESTKQILKEQIETGTGIRTDYFSTSERKAMVICLLYIHRSMTLDELAECCLESKRMIQNDVSELKDELLKYRVEINSDKNGCSLSGSETDKRNTVMYYLDSLISSNEDNPLRLTLLNDSSEEIEKINRIAEKRGTIYKDNLVQKLAVIVHYRSSGLPHFDKEISRKLKNEILELVKEEFEDLDDENQVYIASVLMTYRLQNISQDVINKLGKNLIFLSKRIVDRFKESANLSFVNEDQLVRMIAHHMFYSKTSYEYGVIDINPLKEQVELKYRTLFNMTKQVLRTIKDEIPYPLSDDEVAYFTLLIGSNIVNENRKCRILVVCQSGISASQMIRSELQSMSEAVEIVGVISKDQYYENELTYDFVVSSVPLKGKDRVLVVHPVLNDVDKKQVYRAVSEYVEQNPENMVKVSRIMDVIRPYLQKGKEEEVEKAISEILNPYLKWNKDNTEITLADVVDENEVRIFSGEMDWKQTVYSVGKSLMEMNYIEKSYLDSCVDNIVKNGAYSVYPNDMFLIHSGPQEGNKKLGVSIGIMRNKVIFPDTVPIRFVVVLAPIDYKSHIRILNDLVALFGNKDFTELLYGSENNLEAYKLLRNRLMEGDSL